MIVRLASGLLYHTKNLLLAGGRAFHCVFLRMFSARNALSTRKKRRILHAQGQNLTITFSKVAHFTITFSEVLIVQDYTTSTLRLISNILHTMSNLLR